MKMVKFVDFGLPEGKILGIFRANCPVWKVKIKENEESPKFFGLCAQQFKSIHIN